MKNQILRRKSNYDKFALNLENSKAKLSTLDKNSSEYNKLLKKVISDTISVKGHAFCLDNENERRKLSNIIYKLWVEIETSTS
ncbi:hypothetical protein BH24ACI2_BH24ACI2_03190 [soil metagenome]|jgi:hypothetical protein|nr:hypothetical protein [Acidobacteriota bacterium]